MRWRRRDAIPGIQELGGVGDSSKTTFCTFDDREAPVIIAAGRRAPDSQFPLAHTALRKAVYGPNRCRRD